MAMDRAEKLGLGAAIGGHVVLLGAMALGLLLSTERLTKTQPISVSLVGEIAEVSTAPDAIQEDSAPPAQGETETPEPQTTPDKMQIEKPVPKPVEKPQKRDIAPVPAKAAPKKVAVKQPPAKQAAKSGGLSKNFEDVINNVGKAPGAGKAVGTPAAKSGAEIRRSVSNTIAAEVRPHIPTCAPLTSDNSSLRVFAALSIDSNAKLVSAEVYDVQGITPANEAQVDGMKKCVLNSLRAASPYSLDPSEFETWRNHKVQLKVNFK